MQFSSIIGPYQVLPGSDGNEEVVRIPQSSSITGTSSSDCLVSYPGHLVEGGSYLSAEVQAVYSTALANWATKILGWAIVFLVNLAYKYIKYY